jgi:predicted NBD/HSP70 family sugar kinase
MGGTKSKRANARKVLVIDVGGTNVKIQATGQDEVRKIPSGFEMSAKRMVAEVKKNAKDWSYDVVSIGYPGLVVDDLPLVEPRNLARGWVGFDYAKAFGCPVRIINDAAMQALGSYEGGRMLFLGLGTGLGAAMVRDGEVVPMELAHLQYRKGRTFEDYLGRRGLERLGKKKWAAVVADIVTDLKKAAAVDYIVLGGGNVKKLKQIPPGAREGANANAFRGGFRMWE